MDAVEGLVEVARQERSSSCGRSPRPTAGRPGRALERLASS